MKRFFLLAGAVLAAALFAINPAFAQAAAGVAGDVLVSSCTPSKTGIDLCPLVPVVNGLITAIAGLLTAAVPVVVGYMVMWLRNHGIAMSQQAQKVVAERITNTIQNGLKYAISGADVGIQKITIPVENDKVRAAANYAIAQSPELLKKAGIDVRTEAGQQALIRRIIAESQPTPPALAPTVNTNVTSDEPKPVGDGKSA